MKICIEVEYECDYSDNDAPKLKGLYKPGSTVNVLPTLSAYEQEQAQQALISAVEDAVLRRAEQIQMRGDIAREFQREALAELSAQRGVRS